MHNVNFIAGWLLVLTFLLLQACSRAPEPEVAERWDDEVGASTVPTPDAPVIEAVSWLGAGLVRPDFDPVSRDTLAFRLRMAIENFSREPDNPESIIWVARHTAAFWRFNDAIFILTDGLLEYPNDPRFYRFRGHYYLSTRQIDQAVDDLQKARDLLGNMATMVEADDLSGSAVEPSATYAYTVHYHLGLALYLSGNFVSAAQAFTQAKSVATNHDTRIQAADWLVLARRRAGDTNLDLTGVEFTPTSAEQIMESRSNWMRMQLMVHPVREIVQIPADFSVPEYLNVRYGQALTMELSGDRSGAQAIYTEIVDSNFWAAFSYIAAEAALKRLEDK